MLGCAAGSDEKIGKSGQREILLQIKVWKTQEYFVYFKFFKLRLWGKRSAERRRRFFQRFPNYSFTPPAMTSLL